MARPRLKKPRDAHGDPIYSGTLYVAYKSVRCEVGDKSIRVIGGTLRPGDHKHLAFPDVAKFYKPVGTNDPASRAAAPPTENMLTATKSGVVTLDGRRETITKGRTRVVRGHELALAHPEFFGGRAKRAPKVTRKTSTAKPKPAATAKLRATAPATHAKKPELWFVKEGPAPLDLSTLHDYDKHRRELVSRHEAGHVCAAHALGWRVMRVYVEPPERGGGWTGWEAPARIEKPRKLREEAIIALAGGIAAGWSSDRDSANEIDNKIVRVALDYHVGGKDSRDWMAFRAALEGQTRALFAQPVFRRRVDALARELYERGELNEHEIADVLRRAAA